MHSIFLLPIACIAGLGIWLAVEQLRQRRTHRTLQTLVECGECCTGRVIGIQRPCAFDPALRVYFDYVPAGTNEPMRGCHVQRGPVRELPSALLSAGAPVSVRYLAERPEHCALAALL